MRPDEYLEIKSMLIQIQNEISICLLILQT